MIPLANISILLLEPQSPGNIGSVARVMKNMGLTSLYLINPQTEISAESFQLACGADDILDAARRTETLPETLQPFSLCVGTTSRSVDTFPQVLTPHQLATQIAEFSAESRIALLFGPERTGLTNEHVKYCQWLVTIPSNPAFESMNLSHAVAILAYELYSRQPQTDAGQGDTECTVKSNRVLLPDAPKKSHRDRLLESAEHRPADDHDEKHSVTSLVGRARCSDPAWHSPTVELVRGKTAKEGFEGKSQIGSRTAHHCGSGKSRINAALDSVLKVGHGNLTGMHESDMLIETLTTQGYSP